MVNVKMSIIRARLREIPLDTGNFTKFHKLQHLATTGVPVRVFSTILPCSQLPLPLVGITDYRGDGNWLTAQPLSKMYYICVGNQPKGKCSSAEFYRDKA